MTTQTFSSEDSEDALIGETLLDNRSTVEVERDLAIFSMEEGQQIISELTAALAAACEEKLVPCVEGCCGHFGPKARAVFNEALATWTAMESEAKQLRSAITSWKAEEGDWKRREERLLAEIEMLRADRECFRSKVDEMRLFHFERQGQYVSYPWTALEELLLWIDRQTLEDAAREVRQESTQTKEAE